MAYALVKAGTVASNAAATVSPTFGQATGSANLLIAWVIGWGASADTATTATGWVVAKQQRVSLVGTQTAAVWYRPNSGSGETAPTFTMAGATQMIAALAEFSGGATSSPVDQIGFNTGGTTSPQLLAQAVTDVSAGELFVPCLLWTLSKAGTATTADTYVDGATPGAIGNNDATSTTQHYRLSYEITVANTAADQLSQTNSSMNISVVGGACASFLLFSGPAVRFPRNPAIDFIDPAFV